MDFRGAVLDVDGTLVRGDDPVPGAAEGHRRLRAAGLDCLYVTNNPVKPPEAYVERLDRAGFDVDAENVLTAGVVTATYLSEQYPNAAIHVVGEEGLRDQLRRAGCSLVEDDGADPESADVLLASIDREFDYDRLSEAYWVLAEGEAAFVGSDPDMVIPAPERDRPGSGAVINAIAGVADRDPEIVLGKPSDPAGRLVRERLGHPPERCLVVGDRLDTDIAMGERAGMTTALVRSGVTDDDDLADSPVRPDYVLDSLAGVDTILED
jgi:4-nitrophenyl phosphatase